MSFRALAKMRQDPAIARMEEILAEFSAEIDTSVSEEGRVGLLASTFPEQIAYIDDLAPFKFILCTRRAAKTYSIGIEFIKDGYNYPNRSYLYVLLTRIEAKRVFWEEVLKDIEHRYHIGLRFNESELCCRLPNGARIYVLGADSNEEEKRKLLGGKHRKIAIDEAQAFRTDLRKLVYGILSPSVADLRGSVTLAGTPGDITAGFFHQVTKGCRAGCLSAADQREPGWKGFTWETSANPHMRQEWQEKIAQLRAANPLVDEVPWFRQNYLGEWVIDADIKCYRFRRDRNNFQALPFYEKGEWHYVLGIDLGYHPDPSAFILAAFHDYDSTLYMLESWKEWKMDITDVAKRVGVYQSRYTLDAMVIDGANKQAVEEMRRRHSLPLVAADKRGKEDFIEIMNAEFTLGKIKVNMDACNQGRQNYDTKDGAKEESLSLADEYDNLIWDEKELREKGKRKEHSALPNHLADAGLYAWRYTYTYLATKQPANPAPNTPEWYESEQVKMRGWAEQEMERRLLEQGVEPVPLGSSEDWESWAR